MRMAAPLHAMLRRLSIVLVIHTERKGTKNPALFVVEREKIYIYNLWSFGQGHLVKINFGNAVIAHYI